MENHPNSEKLEADIEEIKKTLSELNKLQALELLEIRKNRFVNSRRLASVGNRLFQLLLLTVMGGAAIFLYKELDVASKNKIAESYISQLAPVAVSLLGVQQLISNRKEQAKYEEDDSLEEDELITKYLAKGKDKT